MGVYGGMSCPPICPGCRRRLHWSHMRRGSRPCDHCGHEHPNGLSYLDYFLVQSDRHISWATALGQVPIPPESDERAARSYEAILSLVDAALAASGGQSNPAVDVVIDRLALTLRLALRLTLERESSAS
jgi:hypothetical protein